MVASLLILARCAGFVFRAPGFSHPSVPPPLRAGFALLLTVALAHARIVASPPSGGAATLLALALEFAIGSALGMAASLLYDAAYAAGRAVDDFVGVRAIAPTVTLVAPSGFGRVWSLACTGAFFLSGAYRIVLLNFARSFERIPCGGTVSAAGWASFAAQFFTSFVRIAADIAGPAIGVALVVQIAVGALARVVPRFGSVTLAFPLAFAAALVITALTVPSIAARLPRLGAPDLVP
ncbi:MAG: flagellar biosynthetic protein FliR [Candidatus Eremiobacteraeota bacterium]|nr:flagellar biosynthetic protein FliR [Candidatus Eremiobacteraeota bacterium]